MFGISHAPELILLLIVALVIFGPKRIPEIGQSLGKGIKEFKKSTQDDGTESSTTPVSTPQITNAHQTTDVRVPEPETVVREREAG